MLPPVVFLFVIINVVVPVVSYTCSCYCPNSNNYVGTAYASTCSTSACVNACYMSWTACSSRLNTYGTCDSYSASKTLTTGGTVGAIVGGLFTLGFIIIVIVLVIVICKRKKRAQIWALQAQQRQQQQFVMQPTYTVHPQPHQQPWMTGMQQYPPAPTMYYGNGHYPPPPYSSVQPYRPPM